MTHIIPISLMYCLPNIPLEDDISALGHHDPFQRTVFPWEKFDPSDSRIYSMFLEVENFTLFFCNGDNWKKLIDFHWVGLMDKTHKQFQVFSVVGSLMMIKKHGGKVSYINHGNDSSIDSICFENQIPKEVSS